MLALMRGQTTCSEAPADGVDKTHTNTCFPQFFSRYMETSGSVHGDTLLCCTKPARCCAPSVLSVSPMALFFAFIAGVLVSATASRVGSPLWRSATALAGRSNPDVRTGALIASFALAAGILYVAIGFRHSLYLYVTSQVLRPAAGTRLALVINREIG